MAKFRAEKVVSALPDPLEPDTVYYVRTGDGIDMQVSDATGSVAHKHNALVPAGGTTGQVLAKASATDFDGEWVDPASGGGGGDIVLLQTVEITSPVAAVDITGLDRATYPNLMLLVSEITGFSDLAIRTSTDNGVTYDSGASSYVHLSRQGGASTSAENNFGLLIRAAGLNSTDKKYFSTSILGNSFTTQGFGVYVGGTGIGNIAIDLLSYVARVDSTLFDGLRLYSADAANIESGTIKVYGVK
ncbi:hypothetical protein [Halomonas sp.]|uniref:hypothetical protein n=1 Tax=Halomonas sp. TaxID=1486246 RepID=UPI003D0A706A